MSQISKQGAVMVRQNIEKPLRAMWDEIEKTGLDKNKNVQDAYNFIFRFLEEVDGWDNNVSGTADPKIVVNGKNYTEAGK